MSAWEPAVGDVVRVSQGDSDAYDDVGEIEEILSGGIAVRIVQEESAFRGQRIYFNKGQLEPVTLRSV